MPSASSQMHAHQIDQKAVVLYLGPTSKPNFRIETAHERYRYLRDSLENLKREPSGAVSVITY
ncbi:hypothetical protein ALC57_06498 [Trachymyrmex cornetzi]|uniref:Uncharacterized protein n=1 Tax=Trachymyrmex cornetzi TaxID=471704 RepID=A0A151J8E7_9HYME|nr:hypothetical protein ALC57_06498 [Trachymyrmex cornetzi]